MEWVVECAICRRPFVVEAEERPSAVGYIRVPVHEIPGIARSRCMGCDESGLVIGTRSDYKPRRKAKDLLKRHPEYAP